MLLIDRFGNGLQARRTVRGRGICAHSAILPFNMGRIPAVLMVWFFCSKVPAHAAEVGGSAPFSVTIGERSAASVKSAGATCTIAYSTIPAYVQQEVADSPDNEAAFQAVSALTGTYSRQFGDWTYTVILGAAGRVTQEAGSTFSLGKLDTTLHSDSGVPAANRLSFIDGDVCDSTPGRPRRRTDVTLHCGLTRTLVSGREPATCTYAFALSDPGLCEWVSIFPRHPGDTGGSDVGSSGGGASPDSLTLSSLLPPASRARIAKAQAEGEEGEGSAGMAAGARAGELLLAAVKDGLSVLAKASSSSAQESKGDASSLSSTDVAGVGGASLGVDDRERHGGRWSGLQAGVEDGRSAWTLALQPTWPGDMAREGGEEGVAVWTCSAWSIDDLRRGTEGAAGGGVSLQSGVLTLTLPRSGEGIALVSAPQVLSAVARNARRQSLPVSLSYSSSEEGGVEVRLTVRGSGVGADGEGGGAVQELAFVSLVVAQEELAQV